MVAEPVEGATLRKIIIWACIAVAVGLVGLGLLGDDEIARSGGYRLPN